MQYSQEHLKTMVYAEFGGQTECIMGNWKIENSESNTKGGTFYQLKITWVVDVMETTKEGTLEQLRLTRRPWKKIINNMINTSWIIW